MSDRTLSFAAQALLDKPAIAHFATVGRNGIQHSAPTRAAVTHHVAWHTE